MHKAVHSRDDVERLYVSRNGGGIRLPSIEYNVDASIERLKDNIGKRGGRLITATRNNTDNTRTNTTDIKWEEKQLYGRFKRLTNDISHEKTWTWVRK